MTYVDEAVKYDQIGYHVCMAWYPEVQEELCRRGLNFVSVMPSYEFFFRELINRYHERGNNDTFIEKVILIYKENHKDGFSKYKNLQFICKGNLEDWLLENGVNLNLRYGTPEPIKMDLFDSECSKEIESFLSKLNDLDKKRNFVGNELLSYTDYNVDKVRDYIKKDPARIEQVYKLYYDGVEWEEIAKVTGLGRYLCQAILTYFKELRECEEVSKMDLFDYTGITVKDVRRYIKENPKDAKKAWCMTEEGYYQDEVAKELNIELDMCRSLMLYFHTVGDVDIKDVVLSEDEIEECTRRSGWMNNGVEDFRDTRHER